MRWDRLRLQIPLFKCGGGGAAADGTVQVFSHGDGAPPLAGYSLLIKSTAEEELTVMMGGGGGKGLGTHLAETPQEIFAFLYQLIMQHLCFGVSADCPGSKTAKKGRRLGIRHTVTMYFHVFLFLSSHSFQKRLLINFLQRVFFWKLIGGLKNSQEHGEIVG